MFALSDRKRRRKGTRQIWLNAKHFKLDDNDGCRISVCMFYIETVEKKKVNRKKSRLLVTI